MKYTKVFVEFYKKSIFCKVFVEFYKKGFPAPENFLRLMVTRFPNVS